MLETPAHAVGNYDEFRFFTGLRPSEQIALVLSDVDLLNGIDSVNKREFLAWIGARPRQAKTNTFNRCAALQSIATEHTQGDSTLRRAFDSSEGSQESVCC